MKNMILFPEETGSKNHNLVSRGNKIQETHRKEIQSDLFFLFNHNDKRILTKGE